MSRNSLAEKLIDDSLNDGLVGILYIDIDYLAWHNDCFGHLHGDESIDKVRTCIKATSGEKGWLQVGGDEFIVVVSGDKAKSTFELGRKLREAVESASVPLLDQAYRDHYPAAPKQKYLTVSIGALVIKTQVPQNSHSLFELASASFVYAKISGKNRVIEIDLR